MPYLLDGNNLIGRVRGTSRPTEEDRQALVAELADRLRTTRARAVLFFDGPPGERASSLGGLSVRPAGGSADDAIVAEVLRSRAPGEAIVVTSDQGLARRVRDAGGKVCPPDVFFSRFGRGASAAAKAATEAVDVDAWLEYFGDERNRDGG